MIGGITLHQGKIAEMKTGEARPWFQLYQPISILFQVNPFILSRSMNIWQKEMLNG